MSYDLPGRSGASVKSITSPVIRAIILMVLNIFVVNSLLSTTYVSCWDLGNRPFRAIEPLT